MSEYVDAEGRIEGLGNSEVQKTGTLYSVVKLRSPDGKAINLTDVAFPRRCNVEIQVGEHVRLLGIPVDGKVLVFAVQSDGEVVDDVAELSKAKGSLRLFAVTLVLLCVVTIWTIIIPLMLVSTVIRNFRVVRQIPSEADMRREIAARLGA